MDLSDYAQNDKTWGERNEVHFSLQHHSAGIRGRFLPCNGNAKAHVIPRERSEVAESSLCVQNGNVCDDMLHGFCDYAQNDKTRGKASLSSRNVIPPESGRFLPCNGNAKAHVIPRERSKVAESSLCVQNGKVCDDMHYGFCDYAQNDKTRGKASLSSRNVIPPESGGRFLPCNGNTKAHVIPRERSKVAESSLCVQNGNVCDDMLHGFCDYAQNDKTRGKASLSSCNVIPLESGRFLPCNGNAKAHVIPRERSEVAESSLCVQNGKVCDDMLHGFCDYAQNDKTRGKAYLSSCDYAQNDKIWCERNEVHFSLQCHSDGIRALSTLQWQRQGTRHSARAQRSRGIQSWRSEFRRIVMLKSVFVYILASRRYGTLYSGVTNDLIRRMYEHKNHLVEGFTQKYDVTHLVWYEQGEDMIAAIALEKKIKNRSRKWKIDLIEKTNPGWIDLSVDWLSNK